MVRTGSRLGPYELGECIGEGGSAQVFRARHLTLGTEHAVKIPKTSRPTERARFLEEARGLALVRHPNLLAVHDVLDEDGTLALVLELLPGSTLHDWRLGGPPHRERLRVFRELCTAVRELHAYGYVHRDVKPDNILMATVGGAVVPKLGDLGIAKVPGGRPQTLSGVAMGTPLYMAPEQFRNADTVDHRADLFALGVILYELVADVGPYADVRLGPRIDAPLAVVPLRRRVPGVEPGLADLVDRLLSPRPEDRPASADEVVRALDGRRTTLPGVDARPASVSRAPAPGRLAAFVALGGLLGLGLSWVAPSEAEDEPPAPLVAAVAPVAPVPQECTPAPVDPVADAGTDEEEAEEARPARSAPPQQAQAETRTEAQTEAREERTRRGRLFKRKPRP